MPKHAACSLSQGLRRPAHVRTTMPRDDDIPNAHAADFSDRCCHHVRVQFRHVGGANCVDDGAPPCDLGVCYRANPWDPLLPLASFVDVRLRGEPRLTNHTALLVHFLHPIPFDVEEFISKGVS
eukprot:2957942-Lingulodinium_polyedra.AAC.1